MSTRTRYLQLSDTMMMEYSISEGIPVSETPSGILYTSLKDGHKAIFSPLSCEFQMTTDGAKKRDRTDIQSANTLQHLAVPTDTNAGSWFTFIDSNKEFITDGVMDSIDYTEPKAAKYAEYCVNPVSGTGNPFVFLTGNMPGWDKMRIYFVNGYNFDDINGFLIRIQVRTTDNGMLDLCDFYLTRNTAYELFEYIAKPLIFGNFVYDKYIDINVPSVCDICQDASLSAVLKIQENTPIRLGFSYVDEEDVTMSEIDSTLAEQISGDVTNDEVYCDFVKGSSLNGAIPMDRLNSDNLGAYIAESSNGGFLEFYGTWKGQPLSTNIVQNFNKTITLYDQSLVRKQQGTYEVDPDYEAEYNLKKWIAVHEIECDFMHDDTMIKSEDYSMTQIFADLNETEPPVFRYRPFIFESSLANMVTAIVIKYKMKLINTYDRVQFVKSAALSLTNVGKFYQKGTTLGTADMIPYKVYNKIIESSQSAPTGVTGVAKTKYVKLFYNSTDITLYDGSADYSSGMYTLTLSRTPKNYKFTFRNKYENNKQKFFDLSSGCYKLFVKRSGENIILDPTYSSNMNLMLGELEFNISSGTINKLYEMDAADRYMSIVSYNDDNSVSSMFDFKFTF